MPINIDYFRTKLLNAANKNRSGFLPPAVGDGFIFQASTELFNEKYLAAAKNQKLDDDLSPFLRSVNLPVTTPAGLNYGLTPRPTDYKYYLAMRAFFQTHKDDPNHLVSCGCPSADNSMCDASSTKPQEPTDLAQLPLMREVEVHKLDAGRWGSVLSHRTKFPTLEEPYCTQFDNGFKVAPRNLQYITMDFYRMPVKAVFAYTQIVNPLTGGIYYQYDSGNSTNIDWPETVFDELLDRTLQIFAGGYLKDQSLFSYARIQKAERV